MVRPTPTLVGKLRLPPYEFAAQTRGPISMSFTDAKLPVRVVNKPPAPGRHPRAACSPDLGGRGTERRHGSLQSSPSLTGSHPLKFPRFSNGLCVPRLPGGRFFAQSGAHLFAVLCANRRTSAQTSRTAPICCIFLQQTPSFSPMGERPFSHPPTPSHDRDSPLKHFEMRARLRRAWRAVPGPIWKFLLQSPLSTKSRRDRNCFSIRPLTETAP